MVDRAFVPFITGPNIEQAPVRQMVRLLVFVDDLLGFYTFVLLVRVIVSWLIAFDFINTRNNVVRSVLHVPPALTDPALAAFRRLVPPIGGLDLSFLVLLLLIQLVRSVLIPGLIDLLGLAARTCAWGSWYARQVRRARCGYRLRRN